MSFGEDIGFYPTGKYVVVHNATVNPCEYSIATLKGHCMRDEDFVKSFASFVREKIKQRVFDSLPEDSESLIKQLNDGPIPELYNVIYATMYPTFKTNDQGFAETESNNIGTKIWSLALDWQSLITRENNAKQAVLGLTVHRLTASKETSQVLHKLGHSISYNSILKYNDNWSKNQPEVHKKFIGVKSLHSSIDNNDGRQDTTTGSGTTHDTNRTLFSLPLAGQILDSLLPDATFGH